MKSAHIALIVLAAAVPIVSAAEEKKVKRTQLFAQLDKNKNWKIDPPEAEELRKTFAKVDSSSPVRKIDQDGDGKIDDKEIAAFSEKYSSKAKKKKTG